MLHCPPVMWNVPVDSEEEGLERTVDGGQWMVDGVQARLGFVEKSRYIAAVSFSFIRV